MDVLILFRTTRTSASTLLIMRWEYRLFYQPKPDSAPVLPQLEGEFPELGNTTRTDVYWVHESQDVGIKERGADEFMETHATPDFPNPLDLKLQYETDDIGYEMWEMYKFKNRAELEVKLVEAHPPLPEAPIRVAIRKHRVQVRVTDDAVMEETVIEAPQLPTDSPGYSWKSIAIEGEKEACETVRERVTELCRAQAIEGTFAISAFPAFILRLAPYFDPASEPAEPAAQA